MTHFSVEEGAALLHAIFPDYPDTQEMLPPPNIRVFLRTLRAEEQSRTSIQPSTDDKMVSQEHLIPAPPLLACAKMREDIYCE